MISHLVLLRPRPDLSDAGRERLIAAFERALRDIPHIRGVRIGRRITHGAGYETHAPDLSYLVQLDFDDGVGLAAYLQHPAHAELGARFGDSLAGAIVYDFESVGIEGLRTLR